MSFEQGLSGLNAASNALSVTGNNVANASTVGFKESQAQFADVYANSLQGGGGAQIGIGTSLARVQQSFTQGNITSSSNAMDVAINGKGFFRMASSDGSITYTRNGQFQLDKNGQIVNAAGQQLTGYALDPQTGLPANGGAPSPLTIDTADLAPVPTTQYNLTMNLDSRVLPHTEPFDPNNASTYDKSVAVPSYDSLGNPVMLQTYYVNRGPDSAGGSGAFTGGPTDGGNVWDVYATVTYPDGNTYMIDGSSGAQTTPPSAEAAAGAQAIGKIAFTTGGTQEGVYMQGTVAGTPPAATVTYTPGTFSAVAGGSMVLGFTVTDGSSPMQIAINHGSSTQFGSAMSITAQKQNGNTSGSLTGFTFSDDGTIMGNYSNGTTHSLGQVALVNFANPNGLTNLGGNQYAETSISGVPIISTPGSSGLGVLQASATEDSNVDLTAELVNMITEQRNYQANAQTIKTQDQIMQTIVNLR
jgi:flagellar hook protein FlgE